MAILRPTEIMLWLLNQGAAKTVPSKSKTSSSAPPSLQSCIDAALIRAVMRNNLALVQNLVQFGSANVAAARDNCGWNALHNACFFGRLEVLQYLLECVENGNDGDSKDCCCALLETRGTLGWTALHYSCRYNHLNIVRYLLETRRVDVEATTDYGWTALHVACRYGHVDLVIYLVETAGANIRAVSKSQKTALHVAASEGHHTIVAYLEKRLETSRKISTKDRVDEQQPCNQFIFDMPDTWNDLRKSSSVLVPVQQWDDSYWQVAHRLQETMPDAHIANLWRIQNKALWMYYSFHKHRLTVQGIPANETTVWHGTRKIPPNVIYNDTQDGFMMQFANNGYWGRGIYFAEKSGYSDVYAFQPSEHATQSPMGHSGSVRPDEREIFVTKLLVGNAVEINRDESPQKEKECRALTVPPLIPNDPTNLKYNTVTGHTQGSRVWIVYENGRAYPEYLVRYYRNPKRDLRRTRYGTLEEAQRCHKASGTYARTASTENCADLDIEVRWEYKDSDAWKLYSTPHQVTLEWAYHNYVGKDGATAVKIRTARWTYHVDLATMVQTNATHDDHTQRLVRRQIIMK